MKKYKNYPYFITENGEVYRENSNTPLKPAILKNGYKRVTFSKKGKIKQFSIHRLVAILYCDNPYNKPDVNHIDNDRSNNHYSNLEWVTHSENMKHCHIQNRCSNLIASNTAAHKAKIRREKFFNKLMPNNLINFVLKNNRYYITYLCKKCNNTFTHRIDTPSIKRGGICRACSFSKDEDIV